MQDFSLPSVAGYDNLVGVARNDTLRVIQGTQKMRQSDKPVNQ